MIEISYRGLPEHMQDGARLYVEQGVPPGDFLTAVLQNDLVEAFNRADATNVHAMLAWAKWLDKDCPRAAWGSKEQVEKWIAVHTLDRPRRAR